MLSRDAYLETLDRDAQAFGELLRHSDLSHPVPDCPGWDFGDLARHLSGIHRWAIGAIVSGAPGDEPVGPVDRDELVAWLDSGAAQLLDLLRTTDPLTPAWTFGPKPRLVEFWLRRQPHETSVHLGDARRALGVAAPVDPAFAADGVDEVVTVLIPRQVRLERIPPLPHALHLELTDTETSYVLRSEDDQSDPAASVRGTAHEVLLALWRRKPVEDLTIEGDAASARAVFALALTP